MTSQAEAKRKSEHVSGISNVAFDLLTMLQHKLQAISALEEYKMDCSVAGDDAAYALMEDMQKREVEDVQRLKGYLRDRF